MAHNTDAFRPSYTERFVKGGVADLQITPFYIRARRLVADVPFTTETRNDGGIGVMVGVGVGVSVGVVRRGLVAS